MKGKTTGELLKELMSPGSFSSYLSRNREQMIEPNVGRSWTGFAAIRSSPKRRWPGAAESARFISTRCLPANEALHGTEFCVCASAFAPQWRKYRNCCARRDLPRWIRG